MLYTCTYKHSLTASCATVYIGWFVHWVDNFWQHIGIKVVSTSRMEVLQHVVFSQILSTATLFVV